MALDAEKKHLLDTIVVDEARQPHTMPGWYYADQGVFECEKSSVFAEGWVAVGHGSEISKPGMYMTATIGDEPVIILRDRDNSIRACSNICRHRGMRLLEGKGRTTTITCPYHAWSYGLDGSLAKAPYMDAVDGFDRECHSLPQFAVEEWKGFIFVNISGDAQPLGEKLGTLDGLVENYQMQARHSIETWYEEWQTNWKSLIENFMEGYHLSVTHAKTLDDITPTELCEKLPHGQAFTAYRSNYRPASPQRTPFPETLTAQEQRSSVLFTIYPNFLITVGPNCAVFLILLPEEPEAVRIKMGVLVQDGADDLPATKAYIDLAHAFNAEDRAILEAMQKNARSATRTTAPLAPDAYEGTIWDFTRYIASRITAHDR
ncbi:MAG: aromatic ring-hydroxylating oxygenase subunit alpha [Candidatus Puniceispirillales bacterium]